MQTTVKPGQTFALNGTFASGNFLSAYGSSPAVQAAAVVEVSTVATNDGTITLFAQAEAGLANGAGATLQVTGLLTNNAQISLLGGGAGSSGSNSGVAGSVLLDSGTLINSGTLTVFAAAASYAFDPAEGTGAQARVSGMLSNSGLISIRGGASDIAGGARPGSLIVSGVLTNTGTISVGAGTIYYGNGSGTGGQLSVAQTGSLTNSGLLTIAAAAQPSTYQTREFDTGPIAGGTFVDAGTLFNNGTLDVQGGGSGYANAGLGASLTIAAGGSLASTGLLEVLGGNGGGRVDLAAGTGATLTNDGVLTTSGTLLVGAAVTLGYRMAEPTAATLVDNGLLTNTGAMTVQGSSGYYTGLPTRPDGAVLIVSGVFDNAGQLLVGGAGTAMGAYAGIGGSVMDSGQIHNAGTIVIGGGTGALVAADAGTGGTISISGTLTNAGLIELDGGTGFLNAPLHGYAGPGAQLVDGGVLTNMGTIVLDSGMAGASYADRPGDGATLAVTGVMTNFGAAKVGSYTYGNAALLTVGAAGTLTNVGMLSVLPGQPSSGSNVLDVAGVLDNSGRLVLRGGLTGDGYGHYGYQTSGAQGRVAGTLINSGTVLVGGGGLNYYQGGSGATLAIDGLLTNNGGITVAAYPEYSRREAGLGAGVLLDAGVVNNNGSLTIDGGFAYSEFYRAPGATLNVTGVLNNAGYLRVLNATGYNIEPGLGGKLLDGGDLINTGTIAITTSSRSAYGSAGELIVTASLRNEGSIVLSGYLSVSATGTLTNTATISVGGQYGSVLVNAGLLRNGALIDVAGQTPGTDGYLYRGTLVDSGRLISTGNITLEAGAGSNTYGGLLSILAGGALRNDGVLGGGGTIDNAGIISSDGHTTRPSIISVASLINDGSVQVAPGSRMFITSAVSAQAGAQGGLDIFAHATLTLGGAVASSQEVTFDGRQSTLALGHASSFAGILDGLQPQTTIDFLRLDVTSASAVGTSLEIGLSTGTTLDLALAAPLAPTTTLQLGSDGGGGTDLLFLRIGGGAAQDPAMSVPHGTG